MSLIQQRKDKLLLSSLRHSLNAVESKINKFKYYRQEEDSWGREALDSMLITKAQYIIMINDIKGTK